MQVRVHSVTRDCFQSQFSLQILLRYPHSPRVQSNASTSVHMLKIPNTGSHTTVWTHRYYTHSQEWVAGTTLDTAVPYPGKVTWNSRKEKWSAKRTGLKSKIVDLYTTLKVCNSSDTLKFIFKDIWRFRSKQALSPSELHAFYGGSLESIYCCLYLKPNH